MCVCEWVMEKEWVWGMEAQGERMRWADVSEGCHAVRTCVCVCGRGR